MFLVLTRNKKEAGASLRVWFGGAGCAVRLVQGFELYLVAAVAQLFGTVTNPGCTHACAEMRRETAVGRASAARQAE